jgi:hypothetical protein
MRADGTLAAPPAPVASTEDTPLELTVPREESEQPALDALAGAASGAGEEAPPVAQTSATPVPKTRQKNKERLAGAKVVENTSGRSATRPAKKQPRSRTQATRKKA